MYLTMHLTHTWSVSHLGRLTYKKSAKYLRVFHNKTTENSYYKGIVQVQGPLILKKSMDHNEIHTYSVSHVGRLTHQILGKYLKAFKKKSLENGMQVRQTALCHPSGGIKEY